MDPVSTMSLTQKIISEGWVLMWFFILVMWLLAYYWPRLVKTHFETIKELQQKYNENLKEIMNENRTLNKELSNTNKEIHTSFLSQLKVIEQDHLNQNNKLNDIHNDIKKILK